MATWTSTGSAWAPACSAPGPTSSSAATPASPILSSSCSIPRESGIVANDDRGDVPSQGSFISANLAAGIYYLAVSTFNLDPYSISGNIFPDFFNCCQHPISINSGPGGGDPLSFWANGPAGGGSPQGGAYRITLNQETVPEPTSVLLLGAGLAALPFFRRKRGRT